MENEWYCKRTDADIGPLSTAELIGMLGTGQIMPNTLVKYREQGEWVPASHVRGILGFTAPQPPAPPLQVAAPPVLIASSANYSTASPVTSTGRSYANRQKARTKRTKGLLLLCAIVSLTVIVTAIVIESFRPLVAERDNSLATAVLERAKTAIAAQRSVDRPEVANAQGVDPKTFSAVRRASKQLEGAVNANSSLAQFEELIQSMATELAIADDDATTRDSKAVLAKYAGALDVYKDSVRLWRAGVLVRSRLPELEAEKMKLSVSLLDAKENGIDISKAIYKPMVDHRDELVRDLVYLGATPPYIPVDLWYLKTDIAGVVERNGIRTMNFRGTTCGWVELNATLAKLWARAAELTAEAKALADTK